MFGGGLFAIGGSTSVALSHVSMANNSAAVGGALATLGGSAVACSTNCSFAYNSAKVGGGCLMARLCSWLASV